MEKIKEKNEDYFILIFKWIMKKHKFIFIKSQFWDKIPIELICNNIPNKKELLIVLQIILYFETPEDFKIDFYYYNEFGIYDWKI